MKSPAKLGILAGAALAAVAVVLVVTRRHAPPPPPPAAPASSAELVVLPRTARFAATPFDEGLPRAGQWRNGFALADLDGDGHVDLVHGPARKGFPLVPAIFLGDDRGHWHRWDSAAFPPLHYDYGDVQARDLDGDGIVDLAFAIHLGGLTALRHDGKGHFVALGHGLELQPGGAFGSRTLLAADWDGGKRTALLALSDGPRPPSRDQRAPSALGLRVFTLPRDSAEPSEWRLEPLAAPATERLFGDSLALGDFDGDGAQDLLVGSGTLGEKQLLFRRVGAAYLPVTVAALRDRSLTPAVAFADLDGDARDDLLVAYSANEGASWTGGIDVLYSKGGGFERRELTREAGRNGYSALTACTLEGQKHIAFARDDGTVSLAAADGHGFFTRDLELPNAGHEGCRGYRLRCQDLDHDGNDELVASFAGESDDSSEPDACQTGGALRAWKLTAR